MKKQYFLITTADNRTWKRNGPVVSLGEWCIKYDQLEAWKELGSEIVPYHWDDRNKLYCDYKYLSTVYESLLIEISDTLNSIHKTDYSIRYWRILVGPWLLYFTEILFDRWESISAATEKYTIKSTVILDLSAKSLIPKCMVDFRNMYVTDVFNHLIYSQIIQGWTSIECEYIKTTDEILFSPAVKQSLPRVLLSRTKRFLTKTFSKLIISTVKQTDAVFVSTYLPSSTEFFLQLSLKQIPFFWQQEAVPLEEADLHLRNKMPTRAEKFSGFENCIRTLIPLHLPIAYLEGYESLARKINELKWPGSPRIIFTSAAYNADDVFKAWTAKNIEKGSKLVIGQHGGNLGSALWTSSEDHEVAIADRYLTWGWKDGKKKHYPVGILKHLQSGAGKWDPAGYLLLVTTVMPRYSYVMGSFPVASGQTGIALDEQYDLVRQLNSNIYKHLRVRLFTPDWNWSQSKRWKDHFADINFDSGKDRIEKSISNSRLVIVVYNGTVFLETLSRNIPTIICWNPAYNELRESVIPYFKLLSDVGVFHHGSSSAAKKIEEVWDDVNTWWNKDEVQEARRIFCEYMAHIPANPVRILNKALTTIE